MSRSTMVILVLVGAGLAGFAFSSTAQERLRGDPAQPATSHRAGPQLAELGWRETYGTAGEHLVFTVESLAVLENGWQVRLGVENRTSVTYEVGDPRATLSRSFGLMLFSSPDPEELESRNAAGTLPAVRPASGYEPELPLVLRPGERWEGTMSASGSLVAASWVRVVFGALVAVSKPPRGVDERVVWITDHAHLLVR